MNQRITGVIQIVNTVLFQVTQPTAQGMAVNVVPDNMGMAIFTTILCCWPLGLVAIMRAQEVCVCVCARARVCVFFL